MSSAVSLAGQQSGGSVTGAKVSAGAGHTDGEARGSLRPDGSFPGARMTNDSAAQMCIDSRIDSCIPSMSLQRE
jgi:hypothetical protein